MNRLVQTLRAVGLLGLSLLAPRAACGVSLDCDYQASVAVASAATNVCAVEFTACADQIPDTLPARIDGRAALLPAHDAQGLATFFVWGDGRWNQTVPASEAARPAAGVAFAGRIERWTVAAVEVVSYLVKCGEAETFTRLQDANGRTWFRAGAASETAEGAPVLAAAGSGQVADVGWSEGTDPAETDPTAGKTVYYWIGAAGADWNDGANWSLTAGGVAAGQAPGALGDVAVVNGEQTVSCEEQSMVVRDLLAVRDADGWQIFSGEVTAGTVTLKTSRPRLGETLVPETGTVGGIRPTLDCAWYRADWTKNYAEDPVAVSPSYTLTEDDREHWLLFVAHDETGVRCRREFYFSELPVAYLTTADGLSPSAQKEEHAATLFIQGNAAWKHQYDGETSVKVRGNTTANYAKKPYKLKLDKKTNLFGMGKNKHWVLLANWNDPSLLRNKLAGDFANAIGFLGMDSTWVQCVLNGQFIGTYQLSEHVRPGDDRVPVFDWEDVVADATDLSGIDPVQQDVSGGYLFEFTEEYDSVTKFTSTAGKLQIRTEVARPEYLGTNPAMLSFCTNFLGRYWQACTAWDGYASDGRHWSELCDVASMVDFFLVNELFSNTDACKHSRFAYLNPGGKLTWGPVWDFDCSSGYLGAGTTTPEVWATAGNLRGDLSVKYAFQKEWASDPWFCHRLWQRYWQIRPQWEAIFASGGLIDQWSAQLAVPAAANDARWPRSRTFAVDVQTLKDFLARRQVWLDAQFAGTDALVASLSIDIATHPYVKDTTRLPLTFSNAASTGRHVGTAPLHLSFAVGDASIQTVDVFVNGLRACVSVPVSDGRVEADIPRRLLTASPQVRDLVSVVAYDSSRAVVARSYAFVYQDSDGTQFFIR